MMGVREPGGQGLRVDAGASPPSVTSVEIVPEELGSGRCRSFDECGPPGGSWPSCRHGRPARGRFSGRDAALCCRWRASDRRTARPRSAGQLDLLLRVRQRDPADLPEVVLDRVGGSADHCHQGWSEGPRLYRRKTSDSSSPLRDPDDRLAGRPVVGANAEGASASGRTVPVIGFSRPDRTRSARSALAR